MSTVAPVAPTGKSRGMIIGIVIVIILMVVSVGVYFIMNGVSVESVGPSAPGPSAAGPSALGPSAAGPSALGPSAAGPSALGPSAAGPSQYMGLLGPSAAGPSALGPSATGPSATGPSVTGPSATGPSATATVPKGRFIKLIQTVAYDENASGGGIDDKNKIINLAELEVFNTNGVNLASGKTVTGSSEYSTAYGYVNLTDGNKTNFAHTKGRTIDEFDYLQVDLGAVKEIKKIVITNRTTNGNIKGRAIGIKAIIYANNGTTVVKETPMITKRADTYTLTFPENVWS